MKRFVRCASCTDCATVSTAGFLSSDSYYCTQREQWSEPDDGCTFGARGQPQRGQFDTVCDIGSQAAVYGWDEL